MAGLIGERKGKYISHGEFDRPTRLLPKPILEITKHIQLHKTHAAGLLCLFENRRRWLRVHEVDKRRMRLSGSGGSSGWWLLLGLGLRCSWNVLGGLGLLLGGISSRGLGLVAVR